MHSLILALCTSAVMNLNIDTLIFNKDDSIKAVFITNLLYDYNNKSALIKSGIDSCGTRWIEMIPSRILYNYYVDTIHLPFAVYKRMVTRLLLETNYFDRCERNEIRGIRINQELYEHLRHLQTKEIIKKYFDRNGYLRNRYRKYQYELCAYFYDKQISLVWQEKLYINKSQLNSSKFTNFDELR